MTRPDKLEMTVEVEEVDVVADVAVEAVIAATVVTAVTAMESLADVEVAKEGQEAEKELKLPMSTTKCLSLLWVKKFIICGKYSVAKCPLKIT